MRITFIGAGNMGGAAAFGLVKAGHISAKDITVTARHEQTLEKFAAAGMNISTDNRKAVSGADVIIIAVKPFLVEQVLDDIRPALDFERQTIISFAAGITSEQYLKWLGNDCNGQTCRSFFMVIPNTAIEICRSMTFVTAIVASDSNINMVMDLFEGTGYSMLVSEKQLGAGLALASCGIAYAMKYIQASAQGGVELGFYPKDAVSVVCQTVMGAAALIQEHGSTPQVEIDKVTTPGGFTIRGLNAMEEHGFTAAVQSGLKSK